MNNKNTVIYLILLFSFVGMSFSLVQSFQINNINKRVSHLDTMSMILFHKCDDIEGEISNIESENPSNDLGESSQSNVTQEVERIRMNTESIESEVRQLKYEVEELHHN
jgi:hypothetical protein